MDIAKTRFLLAVLCVLSAAWDSDAASPMDGQPPQDRDASAPDGDDAGRYDCVISSERPGLDAETNGSWRVTWDPETRVKSQLDFQDADSALRLAWRYDPDGRLIAYAGFGSGMYSNFQHDTKYDEHGQVEDFVLSYPAQPDLQTPSSAAVWIGTSYANEYDAAGQLSASVATPYGPGSGSDLTATRYSFSHDAQGRCQRIEIQGGRARGNSIETRSYDEAGHVATIESEYGQPIGFNMSCASFITTNEYDAKGRLTRSTRRCRATPNRAAWVETHSYASDGGETVETFDYQNDVVNDTTTIDGVEVRFAHDKQTRTAGCANIDAAIAERIDQSCRTR